MTVLPESSGRIKVVLSIEDALELGISLKEMDCSNPETRLLLRALFKTAIEKIGINSSSDRLLIEAYPHISGGGVLYFTPLQEKTEHIKIRTGDKCYCFEFSDSTSLLDVIKTLYENVDYSQTNSALYELEDKFYLIFDSVSYISPINLIAKEYCDKAYKDKGMQKYIAEHGKALCDKNAIYEIGKAIINSANT